MGFEQISIEPVVGQESDFYAIREEDLPQIFEEYDKLAKEMVKREREGKGFTFFHLCLIWTAVRALQNVYPAVVREQNI